MKLVAVCSTILLVLSWARVFGEQKNIASMITKASKTYTCLDGGRKVDGNHPRLLIAFIRKEREMLFLLGNTSW